MITCDRSQPRHYCDAYGTRYFSVSSILNVMHGQEHYGTVEDMARGTELHRLFAKMLTTGELERESPYQAWMESVHPWVKQAIVTDGCIQTEMTMVSMSSGIPFAGTVDLVRQAMNGTTIIDLKTGVPARWHRVQVQAYDKLYTSVTGEKATQLGILYAPHDVSRAPIYVPVKRNPRDVAAFCSALNLLIYRESL